MVSRNNDDVTPASVLTPREQEILDGLEDGLTNRQIASRYTLALSTVKWYLRQVYNKLGVSSREEAVQRARLLGLLAEKGTDGIPRNNLPLAPTPFVGREQELSRLFEILRDPQAGIITIVGPGGIGKTRLALEASNRALNEPGLYPDGIFWISLAPMVVTTEIVASMANSIGYLFQERSDSSQGEFEQLLDYLADKKLLLVMDNAEHLPDAPALFGPIRNRCRKVQLLVTSRERMHLLSEQLFPLHGLALPDHDQIPLDGPADYEAAQLFLNISRRNVPDFELGEGEGRSLLNICQLVEGMPLGLELAASWVGLMSLDEIAHELAGSLELLRSEYQDVAERHQSMQASLDVSWKRLTGEQQQALQSLSVFRSGFTRSSALAASDASLPLLVTLVNKSWLYYDHATDRYQAHELLRQYGAIKLSLDREKLKEAQRRHATYFCSRLHELEDDWYGPHQKSVVAEIESEFDNILAAWRWACTSKKVSLLGLALDNLCNYFRHEGRLKEGTVACSLAEETLSQLLDEGQDTEFLALLARVLTWQAEFESKAPLSERYLEQSQRCLDRIPGNAGHDRLEQASLLLAMSQNAMNKDYDRAIQLGEKALTLFEALTDRRGQAQAYWIMGASCHFKGEYQKAEELLHASLVINRKLANTPEMAKTNRSIGLLARHLGKFDRARQYHCQSLEEFRQLGNRYQEKNSLVVLSYTYSWSGYYQAARREASQAVAISEIHGHYPDPSVINPLCKAHLHLGHYDEARNLGQESLKVARRRGLAQDHGWAAMFLGQIALIERENEMAEQFLLEAAVVLEGIGHIYRTLPRALLSYLQLSRGSVDQARRGLHNVLKTFLKVRSISPLFYCLPAAAQIELAYGRPARALELISLANRFGHVRKSAWFSQYALGALSGIASTLPAGEVEQATKKAQEVDVWQAAERLLVETKP